MIKGASIAAEAAQYKNVYFENTLTQQNVKWKILNWMAANISRASPYLNFLHRHNVFPISFVPPKHLSVVTFSGVAPP